MFHTQGHGVGQEFLEGIGRHAFEAVGIHAVHEILETANLYTRFGAFEAARGKLPAEQKNGRPTTLK